MKYFLYLLLTIILLGCGKISPKGEIQSKNIKIEAFSKLDVKGKFHLFFIPSEENFINIETYPNIAKNLDIQVKDSTLHITENRNVENADFYSLTIYSKNPLKNISVSDSVEMNISGELKTKDLIINLKNNAKFIGAINTKNTEVKMQQKSRANFIGKTQNAILQLADTTSIIAPYWYIKVANIQSKNNNYTEINVEDSLKGSIENTAQLHYYGKPFKTLKSVKPAQLFSKSE